MRRHSEDSAIARQSTVDNVIEFKVLSYIATEICNGLESQAKVNKIHVHASITAQPFFEKRGYQVLKKQSVERNGISIENFVMEKSIQ
ncbi:MAG: GNAT family N-acetyltransferase [Saezia sp.]